MDSAFIEIAQKVLTDRGSISLDNIPVFNSLLADYSKGRYTRERRLLIQELRAGHKKNVLAKIQNQNKPPVTQNQQLDHTTHGDEIPKPGDVIWVNRGLYHHCGIYIGHRSGINGDVIHFAAPEGSEISQWNAVIHPTTVEKFKAGDTLRIIYFPNAYSARETIDRAISRVNEKGYNFATNNCDHFATWCKIGEHKSQQAEAIKRMFRESGKPALHFFADIHDYVEALKSPEFDGQEIIDGVEEIFGTVGNLLGELLFIKE
jgi:hypothetical protein